MALDRLKQEVEGTVRVASIYSVGLSEMVQLEQEFARRQPEAQAGGRVSASRESLLSRAGRRSRSGLGQLPGAEPRNHGDSVAAGGNGAGRVALPSAGAAAQGFAPAELKGVDFIGFDDDLPIRREVDRFLSGQGIEVNVTLHFDNLQMIKEAVAHRVGVSIMPARIMRDEIAQGRLVAIPIRRAGVVSSLGNYSSQEEAVPPVAQAFLELLCEKPSVEFEAV